jgi:hypothetical protein
MSQAERDPTELTPADQVLFDRLAAWVCERRLETPAVLFLETARPLSFVGSQAMHFFEPLARALFVPPDYERLAYLMQDRRNLETLIRTVEREADRRHSEGKR